MLIYAPSLKPSQNERIVSQPSIFRWYSMLVFFYGVQTSKILWSKYLPRFVSCWNWASLSSHQYKLPSGWIRARAQMTFIFAGQPSKRRPFPIKTRVIWVSGIYIYIYRKIRYLYIISIAQSQKINKYIYIYILYLSLFQGIVGCTPIPTYPVIGNPKI